MAITIRRLTQASDEALGVTSGNEVIWGISRTTKPIIQAIPTVAGTAATYVTNSSTQPTDFTSMVKSSSGDQTEAYQDILINEGESYIGVQVTSGTWDITISGTVDMDVRNV